MVGHRSHYLENSSFCELKKCCTPFKKLPSIRVFDVLFSSISDINKALRPPSCHLVAAKG